MTDQHPQPCAVAGCVALATRGLFCTVHDPDRPPPPQPKVVELPALVRITGFLRQRHRRFWRIIEDVREEPIQPPAVTRYSVTPEGDLRAQIVVRPDVASDDQQLTFYLVHQAVHVAQQWRRSRRMANWWGYEPLTDREDGARFFGWQEVIDSGCDSDLQDAARLDAGWQLFSRSVMSCPSCGASPDQLQWAYCTTAPIVWEQRAGKSGWLVVCPRCPCQVSLFLEYQN